MGHFSGLFSTADYGSCIIRANVAFLTIPAAAQTDEIELTRAVIETQRQAIIAKNMELTEAESEEFWPAFRSYRGELAKLGDRTGAMIKNYAESFNPRKPREPPHPSTA